MSDSSLLPQLDDHSATAIIGWAVDRFGDGLCLAASMGDTVLIDLVARTAPEVEVVFLDTGFHFAETLGTVRQVMRRHALRVTVVRPEDHQPAGTPLPDPWNDGTEACCRARKGEPLDRFLTGRSAWMTGLRRADSADRADTPVVELDRRGLIKINPLAAWTDADVERYVAERELAGEGPVVNPLTYAGYPSIGCWPCTEPAGIEGGRSGRWAGSARTECGIHR